MLVFFMRGIHLVLFKGGCLVAIKRGHLAGNVYGGTRQDFLSSAGIFRGRMLRVGKYIYLIQNTVTT